MRSAQTIYRSNSPRAHVEEIEFSGVAEIVASPCVRNMDRFVWPPHLYKTGRHQTPPLPPALTAALKKSRMMREGAAMHDSELLHLLRAASLAPLRRKRRMIATVGILYGRTSLSCLRKDSRSLPNLTSASL